MTTQTLIFIVAITIEHLRVMFLKQKQLFSKYLAAKTRNTSHNHREGIHDDKGYSVPHDNSYFREVLNIRLITAFSLLGPTFIKLAQVLSTRADILPESVISALSLLQDHALPENAAKIKAIIEQELGSNINEVFLSFDETPLASASIGQVHSASLKNGDNVIVKVIKPNVREQIYIDLAILKYAGKFHFFRIGILQRLDIKGFIAEFAMTILHEIDYLNEADNCRKFLAILKEIDVKVPQVYGEYLTSRVIVLEKFNGVTLDKLPELGLAAVDNYRIASDFTKSYLYMVFIHGFYHADPHPGNILVLENHKLAFIDFGMVGSIDEKMLNNLVAIAISITKLDMKASARALAALGIADDKLPDTFIDELERLTKSYMLTELRNIKLGPLFLDVFKVGHKYKLIFPSELFLLVKAIVMCEGVAAAIYPSFSLPGVLAQFVSQYFSTEK